MKTENLTLSELQKAIRDSLYMSLPDFYWVTAEISEIKENSAGHCYLELIEKQNDQVNPAARVKAIIWSSRYRFLSALFLDSTGQVLKEGLKILVRVKIEYHELYGLSLVISDIDPSFTIGEMALKRRMIIRRLEEEGVFLMNRETHFPMLPQRIAVISSAVAAGYRDFMNHLTNNSYKYVFNTTLFEAVMQGADTEKSVIAALERVAEAADMFDAAVIIRGGGSQSDLSWFDNYNIAYLVTQFPIPVITGIGHDKDLSVTDMVAHQALKTPTAVADFLIEKSASAEKLINEMSQSIYESTREIIEEHKSLLDTYRIKIMTGAGRISAGNIKNIEKYRSDLVKGTMNLLQAVKIRVNTLSESLNILDPGNVLKRGYSITTLKGKIIKSINEVREGEIVTTQISDGEFSSKVINK